MLKAELHCHIEGAANPALVRRLAKKYNLDMSDIMDGDHYRWTDFTTFLSAYDRVASVFRDASDYRLLAYDVFMNLASQDTIYAELFVSPEMCPHIPPNDFISAVADGIMDATRETSIEGRMIMTAVRHLGVESAENLAHWISANPHPMVTGFGLAGDERMFTMSDFSTAYGIASDAGLGLTAHAGEFGGSQNVTDALDHLDVSRIGHGVRSIEDSDLVSRLSKRGTVLEVCPTSNIALGVYADFASHPLHTLFESGVRICINSDDPPFFDTTLSQEYEVAKTHFGFSDAMLHQCTRTALESAFVDERTRTHLLDRLDKA